jgi:CheY-like chemotaxis protein
VRTKPVIVLLAEDDPAHAEIVRRNFETSRLTHRLFYVTDGRAALDFLYHRGEFTDGVASPRPDLILLDLRLPRMDGIEVLGIIKTDPDLAGIPVVVLSTSAAEADMVRAYNNHASSYLVKPDDFTRFIAMMKALADYWLAWNRYPE